MTEWTDIAEVDTLPDGVCCTKAAWDEPCDCLERDLGVLADTLAAPRDKHDTGKDHGNR